MKVKIYPFFISLVFICGLSNSQDFKNPESITFDPVRNRYFVSNFGDGSIIRIDSSGVKSYFKTGLTKPLGMVIIENKLYVIDNPKTVLGFNTNDGSPVLEIRINEALFLNDITFDSSGFLYITDSNGNAVFKINVYDQSYSLFVKTKFDNPNGILYDAFNSRLILCYFREKAQINAISLADSSESTIVCTGFDNLDGLTTDDIGNFYVTSWNKGSFANGFNRQGSIYKYDRLFLNEPVVVSTGYFGPADLFFNKDKNELAIPIFLDSKVEFLLLK